MTNSSPLPRRFLFLQGPHGPFCARLARALRGQGVDVWRIGFNGGDRVFWRDRSSYIPYRGDLAGCPDFLRDHIARLGITDLVIYNDTRGYHKTAVEIARAVGLRIHVFEEGYIRPYWVTYERDGSNGHSRLMNLDLAQIRAAAPPADAPQAPPPAHWGNMRQHMFYGALYHFCVLLGQPFYAGWGLTRDLAPAVIGRRPSGIALAGLVHAVLIDYPRYVDPITGLACPPEIVVDRLVAGDFVPRGTIARMAAKGQGVLASFGLWDYLRPKG